MTNSTLLLRSMTVLCISAFFTAVGVGIIAPILPIYAKNLGASGVMIGLMYACYYLSMVLLNPIMGRLSDRVGKKLLIVIGFGLVSLVGIFYAWANNPIELIAVRLLHGVCGAMIVPVVMALVGDLSPVGKEGTYMGTFSMMLFLGMAFGPLAGGRIADVWGKDMAFYLFAGFTGLIFFLILFFLPADTSSQTQQTLHKPLRRMFGSKFIVGLMIFNFILATAQGSLLVFLPLLAKGQHLSITQIGVLASVFIIVAGLFQVPFGKVANRHNKVALVMIGTLLVAVGLVFIPMASGFVSLLMFGAAIGIATAIASPAASALVVQHSREIGMGMVMGTMNTVSSTGMIIGPVAGGVAMDLLGIQYSFYLCALFFVVGTGLFYILTKESRITTR